MDFKNHLLKYLNKREIESLMNSFKNEDTHAVLLNLRKMNDDKFTSLFPYVKKHPLVEHAYIYNKKEYELGKTIYHELGCFYLQEPSAMIVSSLIDFDENDYVLDMCAAPGGKTIGASFKMNNNGVIISNDISKDRCFSLLENVERLGIGNSVVTNNDLSTPFSKFKDSFDKIILDAPCSGSGMFRKDEKMKKDWSYNKVLKFAELQKQLIMNAYYMLKKGGVLSYSTCSYSYEEDEEVIEYLLKNTDAEIIPLSSPFFYKSKSNIGIHLFPFLNEGEGHYICQIRKPGQNTINNRIKEKNNDKNIDKQFVSYSEKRFGDYVFLLPHEIDYKNLNVIRYGIKAYELGKNYINYSHHYGRVINSFDQKIELSEDEIIKYMTGNVIRKQSDFKGHVLLTYKNIPVEIAKTDGSQIKNSYPKGLRKNNILIN